MTFFSHRPQISNFPPIFAISVHFPPVSRKLFFPPSSLQIFPPVLGKFTCFLHTLRVFPPYFDHDAFMHHPMHVLDAPDYSLHCKNDVKVTSGTVKRGWTCYYSVKKNASGDFIPNGCRNDRQYWLSDLSSTT